MNLFLGFRSLVQLYLEITSLLNCLNQVESSDAFAVADGGDGVLIFAAVRPVSVVKLFYSDAVFHASSLEI